MVSPMLVGRDEELSALVESRLAAARGHGTVVLVCGEAGIGKTRLLESFRKTLRGGRAALGCGLCREFGTGPYAPIREALQTLGVDLPSTPAASREEHVAQYVQRIERACRRRHVVLLIEDIHWADDGTLRFLQHLLPCAVSMRLLVVATYRTDEACRIAQLEPYLARLVRGRSTRRIVLAPLQPEQVRRLIKLAAGPQRSVSPEQIEDIAAGSEGNPLFAEELLKNAMEGSAKTLPLTIRATVLERVAGLDARSREILSFASVLGRRFDATFLAAVSGIELDELLPIVRGLRNLQLIDEIEGESWRYAFRHALTREAVYGELLTVEARLLHGRILRILEDHGTDDYGDLGYHAWAAGDAARAERYNERAGEAAHALHAYGEAVRSFQRALEYARDPLVRGRLFVKAAQSSGNDGRSLQAVDFYACAIEALRDAEHPDRLVQIYGDMSAQARICGDTERGIAILEKALRTVPDRDSKGAAMIGLGLAYLMLDRGDVGAAYGIIATSAAAADTMSYHKLIPYAALVSGDVATWRSASANLSSLSRGLGADQAARARFNRAFGLTIFGFDAEAAAEFESLIPELRSLRLASLEVLACANFALVLARAGRLSEGRQLIERAAVIPEPSTTGPVALAAAALTIGYGLWDESLVARLCSEELLDAAFRSRINSTLGRIAGPWARWLNARGNRQDAQAILERAIASLPAAYGATESFVAAAELGNTATRALAFERIPLLDSMPHVPAYAATAAHLKALQALHEARSDAVTQFAQSALERYRDLGWVMHEARCRELLGERKRAAANYRRLRSPGGMRSLAPPASGVQSADILSGRERQVASLVVSGNINKQIAEHLAINQRTVEKYLTSIYGKLGLRNRSELAAFFARNG
jgi:DNA-binding CsgD family transcriptional regulator